jgi:hypothetical protein
MLSGSSRRPAFIGWLLAAALGGGMGACARPSAPAGPITPPPGTTPQVFVPGTSYFGDNDYVEYIAGNLPVIFSAPHGGTLTPSGMPARVAGAACGPEVTTVRDMNTEELARELRAAFFARTGKYPHIIINRLHRSRLDANRPIAEAACGNGAAEEAWRDFQAFVSVARAAVIAEHTRGWFTDLHGHGHAIPRLELGYNLSGATLRSADGDLDAANVETQSSIATFSQASALSFSALLRGPTALGTLFADAGYPAVPSAQDPAPDDGEAYFSGGYNTEQHSCLTGGQVCGVQIEANNAGVRDSGASIAAFAAAIVTVYAQFVAQFGITIALQ